MSKWNTQYRDKLPDSAFLLITSTGERKLPVRNHLGKLSISHINNALARLNQVKDITKRQEVTLRKQLWALQSKYYIELSKRNPSESSYKSLFTVPWQVDSEGTSFIEVYPNQYLVVIQDKDVWNVFAISKSGSELLGTSKESVQATARAEVIWRRFNRVNQEMNPSKSKSRKSRYEHSWEEREDMSFALDSVKSPRGESFEAEDFRYLVYAANGILYGCDTLKEARHIAGSFGEIVKQ